MSQAIIAEQRPIEMKVFNTMTRQKERFVPLEEGKVKMYACGPTVYNYFHLGNARPLVTFDLLRRFLEYIGYDVTFVQNFTDIDDKVIRKANEEGVTFQALAERYIQEYYYDADRLGVRHADIHPRATETIAEIVQMVQTLIDKGYCYVAEDGVYFEARKFAEYGKLSRVPLEDLVVDGGERRLKTEQKRNPEDFAVWKLAKAGEPSWASPWGDGRPGWHIECSAMNHKFLGETIDIHCGGQDLVFPHHENEIAQSEAAHGKTFARYWMHNGFINVDEVKMAKSAGNFFTVRDLAARFPYEVLRFFMIGSHYRSPINFSDDLLEAAGNALERIKTCVRNLDFALSSQGQAADLEQSAERSAAAEALARQLATAKATFMAALADDLNTSDALAEIFALVYQTNLLLGEKTAERALLTSAAALIRELMSVLGFELKVESGLPAELIALVEARTAAKKQRDFARADALRAQITEQGYRVEDTPQGPKLIKIGD